MTIRLQGIAHVLSENRYSVPSYQRSYAWEEQQVLDLIQDVLDTIDRGDQEYFLGSVVVTNATDDSPEVVDGQQRLATTSILIAAIRDWFRENRDPDRAGDIERKYLLNRDLRTQEALPRLRLNTHDNDFYLEQTLKHVAANGEDVPVLRRSHERLASAMSTAKTAVTRRAQRADDPTTALVDWIEFLDRAAKVILVTVPSHSNAFTIFETLNDRGLALAISDLLKNHVFHMAGRRLPEAQEAWTSMSSVIEATGDEQILVSFIRHYWSSMNGATRQKDLYDEIRDTVSKPADAVHLANQLHQYAEKYSAILNPSHSIWKGYSKTARQRMETMNTLRMTQIRPLLLAVLAKFSAPELGNALKLMVSWGVRFLIVGGLGGGTMERHYSDRAKDVQGGTIKTANKLQKAMKPIVPTDEQFRTAFATATVSTKYLARYYLRALEQTNSGQAQPELVPNPNEDEVNLEHVLPQKPGNSWPQFTADQALAYSRRLGNMVLMASSSNSLASNAPFSDKKKYYAGSQFLLTKSISGLNEWTIGRIETRQQELADLAVETWNLKM
jgi:hypothetical protein